MHDLPPPEGDGIGPAFSLPDLHVCRRWAAGMWITATIVVDYEEAEEALEICYADAPVLLFVIYRLAEGGVLLQDFRGPHPIADTLSSLGEALMTAEYRLRRGG